MPLLERYPRQLSGGQRQRVAMGRAIVRDPQVFLFDEPLSNLDPALRAQVRVDIRKLHDELGVTSVYVTHDQVEAMTLADVLYVLEGGEVQQHGPPIEIYRNPANRFVARFLGSPAMNVQEAKLERRDGQWFAGELAIVGASEFAGLEPGREVLVGVRPHDVAVTTDPALRLAVEVVETLGPELTVHGRLVPSGQAFIAVLPADHPVRRGDTLPLRIDRMHLFDRTTERSLRC
jgi:ABC-type sugar transport system ATPase subunit